MHVLPQLQFSLSHIWSSRYPIYKYRPNPHCTSFSPQPQERYRHFEHLWTPIYPSVFLKCPSHYILPHPIPPTTMVYSSESAKWKAYQFLDPFAANSFLVCNKTYKRFCRPDCDAYPVSELKLEIEFVDECQQAMDLGYLPCEHCDPTSTPHIDVKLLIQTVNDVNALIGFSLPALDEKDEKDLRQPVGTVSKNNLEHYRLVDLACRHLALAAAVSIMNPLPSSANSPALDDGSSDSGKKKRKRRGGVLGFKELAAKSKLSAWHFHRVFKSVTGMTPRRTATCAGSISTTRDPRASIPP